MSRNIFLLCFENRKYYIIIGSKDSKSTQLISFSILDSSSKKEIELQIGLNETGTLQVISQEYRIYTLVSKIKGRGRQHFLSSDHATKIIFDDIYSI